MLNMKNIFLLSIFFLSTSTFAQKDSTIVLSWLKKAADYRYDLPDSTRYYANKSLTYSKKIKYEYGKVKAFYLLSFIDGTAGNFSRSIDYADSCIAVAVKNNFSLEHADIINIKGSVYSDLNQFDKAIELYNESIEISKKIDYQRGINIAESNIGVCYYLEGDYQKSLEYFLSTLKYFETTSDTSSYLICIGNISSIYLEIEQYDEALEMVEDGMKFCKGVPGQQLRYADMIAQTALIKSELGDHQKALSLYFEVIKIQLQANDLRLAARTYNNLADVYFKMNQIEKAIQMSEKAIHIVDSLGFDYDYAEYTKVLAVILNDKGNYSKALEYAEASLKIDEKIGAQDHIFQTTLLLAEIYSHLKNYEKAYELQLKYSILQDSIFLRSSDKAMEEMTVLHQLDKKELENARLTETNEKNEIKAQLQQEQSDKDRARMLFLVFILVLVLVLAVLAFFAYRNKKKSNEIISEQKNVAEKQKTEIENQHLILEEAHKEITDSIKYAKRLQDAILPPLELVKEILPQSFILFQPKDVVSGDFYWFEKGSDQVFIAAADCTGHGVPGAMVSVVCSNALNRTVKEFRITEPSKILEKARTLIIETFAKSDREVKDGMDIALCSLNPSSLTLTFSGANNPLWIVRKIEELTSAEKSDETILCNEHSALLEFKPNKQPVGLYSGMKDFEQEKIQLKKGDTFYIFTDGYADQFGGEKGKKMKYRPFKETLLSLANTSVPEQKEILTMDFNGWRGAFEQVDDVCVIGVRV